VFESHRRVKFKASLTAPGDEKLFFYCSKKTRNEVWWRVGVCGFSLLCSFVFLCGFLVCVLIVVVAVVCQSTM
jgi:hypothetical protein